MRFHRKLLRGEKIEFPHLRGGWRYAVRALEPLISRNGRGVLLVSFVEQVFCRRLAEARRAKRIPYRQPWVGMIHHPTNIPRRLKHRTFPAYRKSPAYIFRLRAWRDSMPCCRGLITFSGEMKSWLEARVAVPVLKLTHPTQAPTLRFSVRRFQANKLRRVIHIGRWLRRACSIHELPVTRLRKTYLTAAPTPRALDEVRDHLKFEEAVYGAPPFDAWDADILPFQSDDGYDKLLSENIVFLNLLGAVANNTVIECIVRNTPILINPLPAVVEHLGPDYPFYYQSLEEAAAKAEDFLLVRRTHEYLRELPKQPYSGEYFLRSLAESELYRGL